MEKIIVAVGSTRRPKLNAVTDAVSSFAAEVAPGAVWEVIGEESPSGVRHTPLHRADLMAGARNRAEALSRVARQRGEPWNYFVGLEGGLDVVEESGARRAFLESWAYVADTSGAGFFGRSGGIVLPELLARQVVEEGVELADAIDAFAGGHGIRDAQGAWGVLTGNRITRQEAFRVAVIAAFAPFYNGALYSQASAPAGR
jgi:non-canonical (house-cleaning) NTP pyrophosphatase